MALPRLCPSLGASLTPSSVSILSESRPATRPASGPRTAPASLLSAMRLNPGPLSPSGARNFGDAFHVHHHTERGLHRQHHPRLHGRRRRPHHLHLLRNPIPSWNYTAAPVATHHHRPNHWNGSVAATQARRLGASASSLPLVPVFALLFPLVAVIAFSRSGTPARVTLTLGTVSCCFSQRSPCPSQSSAAAAQV